MDRRDFLARASVLAAGALGTSACGAGDAGLRDEESESAMNADPTFIPAALGVQLYTLRSVMEDPSATLAAIATLGYDEVELAGLYGMSPAALRTLLDEHGLRAPSTHVGLERFAAESREALFDEAEALGHRWLVCPWTPAEARTGDGYRQLADLFNETALAAAPRGLSLAYHNHDFEFAPLDDGTTGLEVLLDRGEPGLLSFQLDLFWAVEAGQDPTEWFRTYPARWASVHAKDRTSDGTMVAVGDGTLDFARLIEAGVAAGVEHVFVEHDNPDDPLESVARSIQHLRRLRDARS